MFINNEQVVWPCELSQETKEQLLSIAVTTNNIDKIGVPPRSPKLKGIAFITRGVGFITMLNHEFDSSYGLILGKNDWVGAVSIGDFDSTMVRAEQIETIDVVFFAQEKVEKLAKNNDEIYRFLFAITKEFTKKWSNNLSYQACNSSLRVLFALTELTAFSELNEEEVPCIKASQKQIGDICDVSRSRVNESLKKYKKRGYLTNTRECIHILDYKALHQEAKSYGFEPLM